MIRYFLIRLGLLVPVLLGVSLIVFATMSLLPGDQALAILGPYATPENIAEVKRALGLDETLPVQYVVWLSNLLTGDFGWSYSLERPVADEIADRLGPTLLLAGAALAISVAVGLSAGVLAAVERSGWRGRAATALSILAISVPPFWLALLAVLLFAVTLGWFPVSGMVSVLGGGVLDFLWHLALPAVTLAVVAAGVTARLTRVNMLDVLPLEYVVVARAKGLGERSVIWRHAFPNAFVKILPVVGTQIGYVLGGAVYIETVFQWPGLGRALVDAILARDILMVQGGVLVMATIYVLLNLCVDLGQRILDPRISS